MQFVCSKCGHIESVATRKAHCGCGGLWNLDYQPPKFDLGEIDTQLLAAEIERTRRRVNALEYVKIPQMQQNIKYITMKLDENERANTIRLMKVKDIILKEAIEERRETDKAEGAGLM